MRYEALVDSYTRQNASERQERANKLWQVCF